MVSSRHAFVILGIATALVIASGLAFQLLSRDVETPVSYFNGHYHDLYGAVGAPQHDEPMDEAGCHGGGATPFHCH